jgi:oligopeptide/dipeptide ABC transporter ATP-binding protein
MLRLIQPDSGAVFYRNRDVLAFPTEDLRRFRREAQIVFQDPYGSLNPRLRAGEMLEEVLKVHGGEKTRAFRHERSLDLLELVGLSRDAAQRFPHEFSGGQRQRLGIARALSVGPRLLILDEPVSALDLSVQAQILNLIMDLRDSLGLTCVLVAHDLSVVKQVSDRVAVLYLGKVVEVGPSEDLFSKPFHPYTRGLMAAADPVAAGAPGDRRDSFLPGEPPGPLDPPTGCALFARCPNRLKDDECRAKAPPLEEEEGGHFAACWKLRKQVAHP